MFLPELYSGPQNNNSLEASRSFVEKHDCSQSKYPASIGKTCEGGVSYYWVPSSYCLCQSQHALIDDNIIYKGDSCPASAYDHPLNAVNVISNSFPIDHENSIEKNENNSLEINPAAYLREQSEPSALNLDEGGNIQDFIEEKYYSFSTAVNNKGKRKPRNTEKGSQISGPSGSMDRHSKVLTSKGPRDRRIRLSVGTAIKLYFLQESLGFDQPSKAVEWLIKKSQAAIRELPQVSSISCSNISPHVDSDRSAVCVSCHQTGDLSTLSQDNTCTASGDCVVNSHDQILSANACIGQKSSTATTIESSNRGSIVQGEKREQRSKVMSSVSSCITRTTANGVRRKEFRAKAREWARERTRKKETRYNQDSGIYGLLRPSYVPLQSPAFSLQDNSTSASSLNMINETTEANSNRDDFLHSFMFPNPSNLCSSSSLCISSPPAKIQSSLASVHYSSTQQQDISIQSTEVLSSSDPEVFPVTSDSFPQAVATANNCSSLCVFCRYPPDHAHLNPSNLYGSCREESIEMPGIYDSGLQTSFESQSTLNNEIFQELQVNEEIPCLKSSNEYVPSRIIVSNPSAYHGIFGLLQ